MTKDLDMEGSKAGRYNIALFIFFIPYILFEVPSNLILKKLAPSTWLSLIMVLWGETAQESRLLKHFLIRTRHFNHWHGPRKNFWRPSCHARSTWSLRSWPVSRYVNSFYHTDLTLV